LQVVGEGEAIVTKFFATAQINRLQSSPFYLIAKVESDIEVYHPRH